MALTALLAVPGATQPGLELVESVPLETEAVLDDPGIRSTAAVWLELVESARSTLDLEFFYLRHESGQAQAGLEAVVNAVERAAERGVRVRVLVDAKFRQTYPDLVKRWQSLGGIESRELAFPKGVLHAKCILVDGRRFFIGSQNFDWTALSHIRELGVTGEIPELTAAYSRVFEADWKRAQDGQAVGTLPADEKWPLTVSFAGESTQVTPTWSPNGPAEDQQLADCIGRARRSVSVQVMSYSPRVVDYEKGAGSAGYYGTLDTALRAAAARGVKVQLLISDWGARAPHLQYLRSLACLEGVEVRVNRIPAWSGGEIPYSRVGHSKYLVVDGETGWVGTSNWEYSYFHTSRDFGLLFTGSKLGQSLTRFFQRDWNGPYSKPLTVDAR